MGLRCMARISGAVFEKMDSRFKMSGMKAQERFLPLVEIHICQKVGNGDYGYGMAMQAGR